MLSYVQWNVLLPYSALMSCSHFLLLVVPAVIFRIWGSENRSHFSNTLFNRHGTKGGCCVNHSTVKTSVRFRSRCPCAVDLSMMMSFIVDILLTCAVGTLHVACELHMRVLNESMVLYKSTMSIWWRGYNIVHTGFFAPHQNTIFVIFAAPTQ